MTSFFLLMWTGVTLASGVQGVLREGATVRKGHGVQVPFGLMWSAYAGLQGRRTAWLTLAGVIGLRVLGAFTFEVLGLATVVWSVGLAAWVGGEALRRQRVTDAICLQLTASGAHPPLRVEWNKAGNPARVLLARGTGWDVGWVVAMEPHLDAAMVKGAGQRGRWTWTVLGTLLVGVRDGGKPYSVVRGSDFPLFGLGWKPGDLMPRRPIVEATRGDGARLVRWGAALPDNFKVTAEKAAALELNARLGVEFEWRFDGQRRWVEGTEPIVKALPTDVRWRFSDAAAKAGLGMWVGVDLDSDADLFWSTKSAPHGVVVGETASGKSAFLTMMGVQWLLSNPNAELLLCSTKPLGTWLRILAQHPRVIGVVSDVAGIEAALANLSNDYERRQAFISHAGADDDDEYAQMTGKSIGSKLLAVVDEFEDLITVDSSDDADTKAARKAAHGHAERMARKGRSAGIHLLIGTQGASTDVVTKALWRNTPFKVAAGPIPQRYREQAMATHAVPALPGAEAAEDGTVVGQAVKGRGLVRLFSTDKVHRAQLGWLGPQDQWLQGGYELGDNARTLDGRQA